MHQPNLVHSSLPSARLEAAPGETGASSSGATGSSRERPAELDYGVREELAKLRLQRLAGFFFLVPFSLLFKAGMRWWGGYRIENLARIRKEFREIVKDPAPLIICSNHLTYIDSAIIIWALAPVWWYGLHPKKYTWNLPAGDHFKKKLIHRLVAFFSKCIFIHRDGSKDHKSAILNTSRYLVNEGHLLTIFPEGSRSRSGRVNLESMTYGVGKLLYHLKNPRVLCIYLRSDRQETYASYPPRGSRFHFVMEVLRPNTSKSGKEAYADLTRQVVFKIKDFEDSYFAHRGE